MNNPLYQHYVANGIIPKPLAVFGAQPQRVVPGNQTLPAGTGPTQAMQSASKGLTSAVPLSAQITDIPRLQTTVPGPYTVLPRRNP